MYVCQIHFCILYMYCLFDLHDTCVVNITIMLILPEKKPRQRQIRNLFLVVEVGFYCQKEGRGK